ncbi:PepSY-associated TM helix domain-containing protein [Aliarcobacter cryaerophilus]|uniref:ABC transporter permease n=1 Tax=Aliarcobacter cryaerophilus TaxID=28198 RepID=A0A2S9TER2_9BACT|nr:PepSY-associated TM helix domain-containing protein [Aliarcobacter cryaerophilus]PRM97320.1 ABC transporter permease [Arcobacter cryaerophilus gv. crypticus]
MKKEEDKIFKQRLQRVHVSTGVSFSLLMYIAVFFGIFAIILPYIQVWEKPSRHFKMADITTINYGAMIDPILADPDYPKVNPITISFPGYMEDPALKIRTDFVKTKVFNPNTSLEVENEGDLSELAWFLNSMHYGRPLKDVGIYTFGFMAVGIMFLVIGGVYLVLKIKYTNSGKNATSKFSKWHRKIFIWTFAPFIIITLTGALMNIGYSGSAPMTYIASKGNTHEIGDLTGPILFPKQPRLDLRNDSIVMLPINELLIKAKEIAPQIDFQRVRIINWNDSSAIAKFEGYNPYMPFLNGISNKPFVTLSGVDGSLIHQQKVMDKHWSGLFYDSIFFLHFLFGVDTFTRFFILFLMTLSTLAIGFGNLLCLEKKARKLPNNTPTYQGFGKLSLAVMIGVIPATGLLFVLQWLLPFDMENRVLIQKGLFATLWIATLAYSFYQLNSYKTAKEFLYLGGILFILSPIIHFINSGFNPISLYVGEMYSILGVDIGLFIFGVILLFVAYKLPTNKEKIQEFWTKRGVK